SKAYKEYYAVASGPKPPKAKTKYKKKADESVTSPKSKTASASKSTRLKSKAKVTKPDMKNQPTKKTKAKGLAVLSEKADESVTSPKSKTVSTSKSTRLKSKAKVTKPDMKNQPKKKTKAKGLAVLSEVALLKAKQIKLATKRSK
nr:hypothetical protein [Tanacetum cinerariifolium]